MNAHSKQTELQRAEAIQDELGRDLESIAQTERLLIALDFDGTLAPIGNDPATVRMVEEAQEPLEHLSARVDCEVAFVSGRSLESLLDVAPDLQDAHYIASHGAQVRLAKQQPLMGTLADPLTPREFEALRELSTSLGLLVAEIPGVWLERKPAGVAVHTRALSEDRHRAFVGEYVSRIATSFAPKFHQIRGKEIIEFSLREIDKGRTVVDLGRMLKVTATIAFGDDETDERTFAALGAGDLTVKCGFGSTSALHRVDDPVAVARILAELARLRFDTIIE